MMYLFICICLTKERSCLKQKSQTPKQPQTPHKHPRTHTETLSLSLSHTHALSPRSKCVWLDTRTFVNPFLGKSVTLTRHTISQSSLNCQMHRLGNETTNVKTLDLKMQPSQKKVSLDTTNLWILLFTGT